MLGVAACLKTRSPNDGRAAARLEPILIVADRNAPCTLNPLLIGGLSDDLHVVVFAQGARISELER